MYIIPIAWIYVALMMSVAEATNTNGSVLGAIITFVLYGVMPVALMMYFMGTPARKRAIRAREMQEHAEYLAAQEAAAANSSASGASSSAPDAGSHTPADTVTPMGKIP